MSKLAVSATMLPGSSAESRHSKAFELVLAIPNAYKHACTQLAPLASAPAATRPANPREEDK